METTLTPPRVASPAEVYDASFVPALFRQWGSIVADTAALHPGEDVLDVACGTGVLALAAAERVGPAARVEGLDASEEMLAVARRKSGTVTWRHGRAEALPFADHSFDAVVSQFGLMFFNDRPAALREMMRVLRPGGRMVVAVCDALDHAPGYAVLTELLHRCFGAEVADAFRAPFQLGDREILRTLCAAAGLPDARITRRDGVVHFASVEALVSTERACAWTLGGLLDDPSFRKLQQEAAESLRPFVGDDGTISFAMPALLVTATRH